MNIKNQLKNEIRKIKFLPHAIKYDGKREKVHYWKGGYTKESGFPEETITVCARGYGNCLPRELSPKNETDLMTDYFDTDTARVTPSSPYYKDVLKALKKKEEHNAKIMARRKLKYGW